MEQAFVIAYIAVICPVLPTLFSSVRASRFLSMVAFGIGIVGVRRLRHRLQGSNFGLISSQKMLLGIAAYNPLFELRDGAFLSSGSARLAASMRRGIS
jgi:hypothetical protein